MGFSSLLPHAATSVRPYHVNSSFLVILIMTDEFCVSCKCCIKDRNWYCATQTLGITTSDASVSRQKKKAPFSHFKKIFRLSLLPVAYMVIHPLQCRSPIITAMAPLACSDLTLFTNEHPPLSTIAIQFLPCDLHGKHPSLLSAGTGSKLPRMPCFVSRGPKAAGLSRWVSLLLYKRICQWIHCPYHAALLYIPQSQCGRLWIGIMQGI